jgi:GntR family transcriptional regulator
MRVASDLRRQIQEGELLSGEQLPSLDKLAATHQVSRATVQRAVAELIKERLVETRARWGTFVV